MTFLELKALLEQGATVQTFATGSKFGYQLLTPEQKLVYQSHPVFPSQEEALAAGTAAVNSFHEVRLEWLKERLVGASWLTRGAPGIAAAGVLAKANIMALLERYLIR